MTEDEKQKIINTFNEAMNRKIAIENSYGKLASKEMFENKEENNKQYNDILGKFKTQEEIDLAYQQLARLEQENKELKEAYNEISNNSEILHENNCLRIANAKLNEDLSQTEISMQEWRKQSIKYRSALEEINILVKNYCNACDEFKAKTYKNKNDCLYCNYGFIKRKINECLGE